MSTPCPVCSRINPGDASYCYYDGRLLSRERHEGPLHVGAMPFPTKFHFADGHACENFNQLALACDVRWEEARGLLADGIWPAFFGGIGRLDLVAAAKQAAADPDRDRGLSQFLEKLPADPDCLRPPKVALESTEQNLGQLAPGTDCKFELVIVNQGMLLLRGTISSNCDWLVFGDRTGPSQKMFQTRTFYTTRVSVLGNKLRAGLMPLQAEISIDTNGGTIVLPVRAEVPIRPFPRGVYANDVLAGARSPREVARKAKEHPSEAALLFEQEAVNAWYASNGWTYPVEGLASSGIGAIQQFFEALGVTKPPRLELETGPITIKAKIGELLSRLVTIRTEEAKPVYAQAWSNQHWVQVGPIKLQGKKAKIPLEISVPPQPGETVVAKVTILGNGKQKFVLPVSVTVAADGTPVAKKKRVSGVATTPVPAAAPAEEDASAADQAPSRWLQWVGLFVVGFLGATALLVVAALVLRRVL